MSDNDAETKMWERFRSSLAELFEFALNQMDEEPRRVAMNEINHGLGQTSVLLRPEIRLKFTTVVDEKLIGFEISGPPGSLRLVSLGRAN